VLDLERYLRIDIAYERAMLLERSMNLHSSFQGAQAGLFQHCSKVET
jgi:hypothetical protein